MPDDRLIHKRLGHGRRATALTDFEFRVWITYILGADDFGVMRDNVIAFQHASEALAQKKPTAVKNGIDHVVSSGLIRRFEHQGQTYLYQHDWQSWEKVEYPRATDLPKPTADALAGCDEPTQELFLKHPGGKRKESQKRSEGVQNVSQTTSEDTPTTRASASAKRLTANANGSGERLTAHAPLIAKRRLDAAWEGGRVWVPQRAHNDFIGYRGGNEPELFAWYASVDADFRGEINPDMFAFWRARYREKWPPSAEAKADGRTPAWAR